MPRLWLLCVFLVFAFFGKAESSDVSEVWSTTMAPNLESFLNPARIRKNEDTNSSYTAFDPNAVMETGKDGRVVIRIGHLGAVSVMPNDDKILQIAKEQLTEEGLLGEDIDFVIESRATCSEAYEGVAVAAEMFHVSKVRAFIGPYCATELESVAKMATFWNIPVISYGSSTNALSDRNIYKTLSRISSKNTNAIAEATVSLLIHYNWTRVAIATNTGVMAFDRVQVFEEVMHRRGVNIMKKIMFEENADAAEMQRSGLLTDLANNARVVICLFSSTRELSKEFMQATSQAGVNNAEYAYILPWIQSGPKDTSPWIGNDGAMLQRVKDHYANAIIIDDVNGFDDTIVESFLKKVEKHHMKREDLDVTNIYGYIHLYDSLRLYALSVRAALNETGNPAYVTNGQFIWNKMRRMSFEGVVNDSESNAIGTVLMDDVADRAPVFAAFFISPSRDKVMKMVNMESSLIDNCDGLRNRTGCFILKLTDVMTGFWPSENGQMPLDEPVCGYRGQRCSYYMEITIGSALIGLLIVCGCFVCLYRYCETAALDRMPWRVFHDDLNFIDEEQVKSLMSIGSQNTKISNMSTGQKRHAIIGVNTHATYHKYPQRRPIKFIREDLQLLTQMKQCIHDNINPFLGVAFNEKEEMLVLWKFCSRGTVQDIIYNTSVVLDEKFHGAFVRDISLGLEYLHASNIGYHGSLTPWACLIDRNWMVKLSDFGIANPLERWEKQGAVSVDLATDEKDRSQAAQATSILYEAPEMLKNREVNKRRGMDQSWIKQSMSRRQMGDIYAFGMVMYEILFRTLPFKELTDINEMCEEIKTGKRHVYPQIQDEMGIHPDLSALLKDCWSENPEIRPSIRRVRLNTEMVLKTKGSLVDQMMRMMEQYANNLEKLVQERTGMLEEANQRADKLLTQLLPKYIANELKMGRAVPPKLFSSATVLFSDIVGFTTICSSSTPLEVVNMLNGLYTGFDECIVKHNSYKVETIGDAYMVVSGIPEENGTKHIMYIANIALDMREYLTTYQIPHRKQQRVKCRWGFHTGSVAAGVVGLTAPRYCLFGDTVNTSSRMESTGMPGMIQCSLEAYNTLLTHYPNYRLTERGEVEVKGKGRCTTYWLEDHQSDQSQEQFSNMGL